MDQNSDARYGPRPPPLPSGRDAVASNHIFHADKEHENQNRTVSDRVPKRIDSGSRPAPTKTDWAISDPSKNVTVSAETKARWELLRALAGVKTSDDPQTPKPEASVKDPTQLLGSYPHKIVAAQVLQASTAPHFEELSSGPAAAGIHRRNASHGRRPKPPGAAAQPQAEGSDGSHRLRPLVLPRIVNRTNSGKRPSSSGNAPIVRPLATPEPHHDGVSGLSPPRQQMVSRPNREQRLSQSGIQAPKPLQPSSQTLSGLASGLFAAAQVPSAVPHPFPVLSPPAPGTPFNNQASRATGNQMHGNQIPLVHHSQDRSEIENTKVEPDMNLARAVSNKHIPQRAKPSDPLSTSPGTVPTTPTSLADKSPEEVLVLLASGDPGIMAFIYTEEGIEWLISMFLYGSVLLAKSWVDENLLSEEARALLE